MGGGGNSAVPLMQYSLQMINVEDGQAESNPVHWPDPFVSSYFLRLHMWKSKKQGLFKKNAQFFYKWNIPFFK